MEPISEKTIREAAQGDVAAFESLYRSLSKFVYNIAWRIVRTHQDAQEVTQEVFITLHRNLNSFRFESAFKTWVYRMTVNTSINYAKKNTRLQERRVEYKEGILEVPSEVQSSVDAQYAQDVVSRLLDYLNADQRACIVLRNIEGLSYQEMADVLNININTVRSRLKRAREILISAKKEVIQNEL